MTLSICIPTYNRAVYIKRLLENISSQNTIDIEVVIVNDGSNDNTEEVIKSFNQRLNIVYHRQENTGRAKALKKAIELATADYTLLMDDEDYFLENALNKIIVDLKKYCLTPKIIGVVYLTNDIEGSLIGTKFPKSPFETNLVSINADFKVKGDKKQVVKSELLKSVLYQVPYGERRIPTYLLWSRLSNYNVIFINTPIAVKEYLDTGLTKNINKIRMKSPLGSRIIYKELFEKEKEIYSSKLYRLKNSINFFRYNFHANKKDSLTRKYGYIYIILGYVFGYLLFKKDLKNK